jgi:cytochrome oxidase Cu insertion factor (SCO1/SenC/PrrC family)
VLLFILAGYYFYLADKRAIDFSLNNWDGKTVTLQGLKGKVVVLTFSYSFCSVRCPVITARLSSLDDAINAAKDVVYLHVSVDPDMDTPERRKKYFSLYRLDAVNDKRWMFVSGQKDELQRVWTFYGIDIKKIESKDIPEGYYMEYTQKIVIIGKEGSIEHETDFYFLDNEMAEKIGKVI